MSWSVAQKRFAAALALFFVWVLMLTMLAVVSGYRPMDRNPPASHSSDTPAANP